MSPKHESLVPNNFERDYPEFVKGSDENTEIEIRFGWFDGNGHFYSYLIDQALYHSVKDRLDSLSDRYRTFNKYKTKKIVEIDQQTNVRKITYFNSDQIKYQLKFNERKINNQDWGIRFSRSYEETIPSKNLVFRPTVFRTCTRRTYIDKNQNSYFYGFKIDLTEVNMKDTQYELELEIADHGYIPSYKRLHGAIKTLYGWTLEAMDSSQIISISERLGIIRKLDNLTYGKARDIISPNFVNRPISLSSLDQTENKMGSIKLDGLHKILVFTQSGVYACAFGFNVRKISEVGYEKTTVMESEYISENNTYHVYDILVHENKNVMRKFFNERMSMIKGFTYPGKPNFKIKKFYEMNQPDQKKLLAKEYNSNKVPKDGIIFTSSKDYFESPVIKWKPLNQLTIDFKLLLDHNSDQLVPYVIDKNVLIKFEACSKVSDIISKGNYQDQIVECKYDLENFCWDFVRLRNDKHHPNSIVTAQSVWSCIHNPINLEEILQ